MDDHQVDPEVLKRLPKTGLPTIQYHDDGSIAWEKLPTKYFWLGLGGLFVVGASMFFFVFGRFDLFAEYTGVAIQPATKICRPYHYHALVYNTRNPLPVPDGWHAYTSIRSNNQPLDDAGVIQAPYGEGQCIDDSYRDCCEMRLRLQYTDRSLGN